MRIAIQLSGQPRFTGDFDFFLKNLKGYDQADWFCYITNNNNVSSFKLPLDQWKSFEKEWAINKLQSRLPTNNFIKSFEISDCENIVLPIEPPLCPPGFYKMWYNVYQSNQLRLAYEKDSDVKYDLIIRVRPDVGLENTLDLRLLHDIGSSIIFPNNNWAGHLNLNPNNPQACDQFAISLSDSMNLYSEMIYHAHTYPFTQNRVSWHNEANLAHHLLINGINTVRGNFNISLKKYSVDINSWN
jgi:hypothetical protein